MLPRQITDLRVSTETQRKGNDMCECEECGKTYPTDQMVSAKVCIHCEDVACGHCGKGEAVYDDLCEYCYRDAIEADTHGRSESLSSIFI